MRPRGMLHGLVGSAASQAQERTFSSALLQPWFNRSRSEFEGDPAGGAMKPSGASEELSGRGLLGAYSLVIPYAGTLDDPEHFKLDGLEDVLLRFDDDSVDNIEVR
ncbi:hypothetical protein EON82_24100 [bacterium]|nr:MAG: hypothetical protein EON82_24100 [bacterium]